MQRIAIVSDIHGNMTAWNAVLEDIRKRGITRIFCLGDLVGKGPDSISAVDSVRQNCEVVVRGNWDELVAKRQPGPHFEWHAESLGEERLSYLAALPFSYHFRLSGRLIRLVHASSTSVYHRVQPWDTLEERMGMFGAISETASQEMDAGEPDVVAYGDVHNAYLQYLNGKLLFNVGSVGNPLDLPQASYCIMEGTSEEQAELETNAPSEPLPFNVQFVRVPYDIEAEVSKALQSDAPNIDLYINEIRTGVYRGLQGK